MKYGIALFIIGFALFACGYYLGICPAVFYWSALSFVIVGFTYFGLSIEVLGKKDNGAMRPLNVLVLLPYLLLTWGTWHLQRIVSRERACDEIVPGLFLGRRPLPGEIPDKVKVVIDLTAEFPEHMKIRTSSDYRCYPALDGHTMKDAAFVRMIQEMARLEGSIYVHCAQGHGRSAAVVAALLIAKDIARSFDEAAGIVIAGRSGVSIKTSQAEQIKRLMSQLVNRGRI